MLLLALLSLLSSWNALADVTVDAVADTAVDAAADIAAVVRPVAQEFRFQDGGAAIFYTLDRVGGRVPSLPADSMSQPDHLVFVIAGAGCRSMGSLLPDYFTGLDGERFPIRILILQKRYIAPRADGQHCSDAFVEADHPSQWLADQREFIERQLALHLQQQQKQQQQRRRDQHSRIVLMGISEGAEPASLLALQLPVSHVVLLSHSGLAPLNLYRQLAADYPHMREGWRVVSAALSAAQPDQAQRIHGRSWRYWSESARVQPSSALLAWNRPVLIGAGEADPLVPVQALHALQKQFADAENPHLTVRIFPDADHGLRSKNRNYLPDFMHQIELWLDDAHGIETH
ncbi:dienelactone hydrolase family protein [Undibacterium sp. SXout7W]|uniref:dienelactone hydrolase family protein n=1 Tax=Undibacterium sp. SXout7W TaxID=3413049 RepID=UPI003BF416EE